MSSLFATMRHLCTIAAGHMIAGEKAPGINCAPLGKDWAGRARQEFRASLYSHACSYARRRLNI
jgi:hypothetical protein